jgi:membrane fusion protein (multidrug efflux system)
MKVTNHVNAATLKLDESLAPRVLTPPTTRNGRVIVEPDEIDRESSSEPEAPKTVAPRKNNRRRYVLGGVLALTVSAAVSTYYVAEVAPYESTDDAFIEAHVTAVAPQVAGRVAKLLVNDNQEVKAGDVLVQIDPSDFQAKLDQERASLAAAKGRLEQANAQLTVDQAKVEQEKANVIAAEAEAKRAAADSGRYQAVGKFGISESQLDLAATRAKSAAAEVTVAQNREIAAESQLGLSRASIQSAVAEVQRSEAGVRQAELDLSYTQLKAPEAGFVTHRSVESGAYVQTGQALMAIVPRDVWVVANFKETQLAHMKTGQPVQVTVDAYPQVKFQGRVDSIQSGSGARFSLLPPENASGNYVKVVQRVPVKIVLDDPAASRYVLGPGMSVVPAVRIK